MGNTWTQWPKLVPSHKWASCGNDLSAAASIHRHIVRRGALDTLCGCSASHPEIWRDNKNKPACPRCVKNATEVGLLE